MANGGVELSVKFQTQSKRAGLSNCLHSDTRYKITLYHMTRNEHNRTPHHTYHSIPHGVTPVSHGRIYASKQLNTVPTSTTPLIRYTIQWPDVSERKGRGNECITENVYPARMRALTKLGQSTQTEPKQEKQRVTLPVPAEPFGHAWGMGAATR